MLSPLLPSVLPARTNYPTWLALMGIPFWVQILGPKGSCYGERGQKGSIKN